MSKIEKYKSHIVDDLIKRTEFDLDKGRLFMPWVGDYVLTQFVYQNLNRNWPALTSFVEEVKSKYGYDDSEGDIWYLYLLNLARMVEMEQRKNMRVNESEDKKQKYYEYIVDNLLKNTIFDQYDELGNTYSTKGYLEGKLEGAYVKLPYPTPTEWYRLDNGSPQPLLYSDMVDRGFFTYLEKTYGAREEDIWFVWDIYRDKMLKIIDG